MLFCNNRTTTPTYIAIIIVHEQNYFVLGQNIIVFKFLRQCDRTKKPCFGVQICIVLGLVVAICHPKTNLPFMFVLFCQVSCCRVVSGPHYAFYFSLLFYSPFCSSLFCSSLLFSSLLFFCLVLSSFI